MSRISRAEYQRPARGVTPIRQGNISSRRPAFVSTRGFCRLTYTEEQIYRDLLVLLDDHAQTVYAECLFVDPMEDTR